MAGIQVRQTVTCCITRSIWILLACSTSLFNNALDISKILFRTVLSNLSSSQSDFITFSLFRISCTLFFSILSPFITDSKLAVTSVKATSLSKFASTGLTAILLSVGVTRGLWGAVVICNDETGGILDGGGRLTVFVVGSFGNNGNATRLFNSLLLDAVQEPRNAHSGGSFHPRLSDGGSDFWLETVLLEVDEVCSIPTVYRLCLTVDGR